MHSKEHSRKSIVERMGVKSIVKSIVERKTK
jgi:hypothetical protein